MAMSWQLTLDVSRKKNVTNHNTKRNIKINLKTQTFKESAKMIKSQLGLSGNNRQDLDGYYQAFPSITIILSKRYSSIAKDKLSLWRNSITVERIFENEKKKEKIILISNSRYLHVLCNST